MFSVKFLYISLNIIYLYSNYLNEIIFLYDNKLKIIKLPIAGTNI